MLEGGQNLQDREPEQCSQTKFQSKFHLKIVEDTKRKNCEEEIRERAGGLLKFSFGETQNSEQIHTSLEEANVLLICQYVEI
jgi:hypothetical protein